MIKMVGKCAIEVTQMHATYTAIMKTTWQDGHLASFPIISLQKIVSVRLLSLI